ncbi:MAG: DUF4178 domain-containing protein [Deltaproteobacteria bacterium]|nr:DUF4178 domain-containing protein [Deltaproteobacteria bacterium]
MLTWLVLAVLVTLSGVLMAYRVGKRHGQATHALPGSQQATAPRLDRTISDVLVDDIVQHRGNDWLVEGVIKYEEDGHSWRSARVVDGKEERWFLVGLDRGQGLNVRLLSATSEVGVTGYPPETIHHGGLSYRMARRGMATAQLAGNLGSFPVQGLSAGSATRCRWWRYQATEGQCLLVEQWGDTYRTLVGIPVEHQDLEMLTGS